jgi:hypothetical protein
VNSTGLLQDAPQDKEKGSKNQRDKPEKLSCTNKPFFHENFNLSGIHLPLCLTESIGTSIAVSTAARGNQCK